MHARIARSVLEALARADLIQVRAQDEALEALARVLSESAPEAVIPTIIHFLDRHDAIDEIYASDEELGKSIEVVLQSAHLS
jgi:hypothetical protein